MVTERPVMPDKAPDLLGVIPQIIPESGTTEDEPEHLDGSAIINLEARTQLEDFYTESVDFESLEEPLTADKTYLEDGMIIEDERGVDVLLADLEEGMQQVEAEYMGELLVAMFADITETENMEEVEHVEGIDVQLLQIVPLEVTEIALTLAENARFQGIEKEFSLYLESLEPEKVEVTKNVIDELGAALKESQRLPEEATNEEKESIEQKLKKLCIQLFEGLGIEYDEETIKQFIQSITTQESFVNINFETEGLSIEALNNMGTREYKSLDGTSLLGGLAQLIKQKMQSHLIIGRYALYELQPSF